MIKKTISAGLFAAMLLSPFATSGSYAAAKLSDSTHCNSSVVFQLGSKYVKLHDGNKQIPAAPYLADGNMIVPLRELAEGLQANIEWIPETRKILITKEDRTVVLQVGTDSAQVGDQTIPLPVSIVSSGGKSYGPVRAVADALGTETIWHPDKRSATISSAAQCEEAVSVEYSFESGAEGWSGGFADLPVKYDEDSYQLKHEWAPIPLEQKIKKHGLLLKGMNRSDDLFMYVTKSIGNEHGLKPSTEYDVTLRFNLATNEAAGMIGIGGSPAESVFVKAGVVKKQPQAEKVEEASDIYYRMNIDIGNQMQEGADMSLLGNIAKPDGESEGYELKWFEHQATVKTDDKGILHLIIGTDSGYEGLTAIYITDVNVTLLPKR